LKKQPLIDHLFYSAKDQKTLPAQLKGTIMLLVMPA